MPIDADLAVWFRSQGNIVREINNLCRFYMDTSISHELEFSESGLIQPSSGNSRKPGP